MIPGEMMLSHPKPMSPLSLFIMHVSLKTTACPSLGEQEPTSASGSPLHPFLFLLSGSLL
jgi:hypothetical protein